MPHTQHLQRHLLQGTPDRTYTHYSTHLQAPTARRLRSQAEPPASTQKQHQGSSKGIACSTVRLQHRHASSPGSRQKQVLQPRHTARLAGRQTEVKIPPVREIWYTKFSIQLLHTHRGRQTGTPQACSPCSRASKGHQPACSRRSAEHQPPASSSRRDAPYTYTPSCRRTVPRRRKAIAQAAPRHHQECQQSILHTRVWSRRAEDKVRALICTRVSVTLPLQIKRSM